MSGPARVMRWGGRWGSCAALLICVAELAPRFPTYRRLDLALERRIKILRFQPWVGVRQNNVLGTLLPDEVQNNTGSQVFGTFYNSEPRRIRFAVRFER